MVSFEFLRAPERELFADKKAVSDFLGEGLVDVRRPYDPVVVESKDIDWAMDPYGDKTWQLYLHSLYWLTLFDEAIKEYPQKKDQLIQRLKYVLLSNIRFILDETSKKSVMVWDDHATSYRASHVSYIYSKYLKSELSDQDESDLRLYMSLHEAKLISFIDSDKWLLSNHTLFQLEGLSDLVAVFKEGQAQFESFNYCKDRFLEWYDRIVIKSEGGVREHSLFYHAFLIARISDFVSYFEALTHIRLESMESDTVKMCHFMWNMSVEYRYFPAVGDTKYDMKVDSKYIDRFSKGVFKNSVLEYLLSEKQSGKPERGLVSYPETGFYFIRNGLNDRELFSTFLHKPFMGPHGHWDGLSFETFFRGKPLMTDSGGPYKYGNKLRFEYFQKPVAHNVVVVGSGQQRYLSRIQKANSSKGITVLKGDAKVEDGVRWIRAFIQLRNDFIVIVDFLDADQLDDGAYAKFQLGRDVVVDELSPTHASLMIGDDPVYGHFFGSDLAPELVSLEPKNSQVYALDSNVERPLHGHSYITDQDARFFETTPICLPMGPRSLRVSVFSFNGVANVSYSDGDQERLISLENSGASRSYSVRIGMRKVSGFNVGFDIDAREH